MICLINVHLVIKFIVETAFKLGKKNISIKTFFFLFLLSNTWNKFKKEQQNNSNTS